MQKHYEVRWNNWVINNIYKLNKGDIITVIERDEHEICIDSIYFNCVQWVRIEDFNNNVVESN